MANGLGTWADNIFFKIGASLNIGLIHFVKVGSLGSKNRPKKWKKNYIRNFHSKYNINYNSRKPILPLISNFIFISLTSFSKFSMSWFLDSHSLQILVLSLLKPKKNNRYRAQSFISIAEAWHLVAAQREHFFKRSTEYSIVRALIS